MTSGKTELSDSDTSYSSFYIRIRLITFEIVDFPLGSHVISGPTDIHHNAKQKKRVTIRGILGTLTSKVCLVQGKPTCRLSLCQNLPHKPYL